MQTNFIYRKAVQQDMPQLIRLGLLSYGQYTSVMSEEHAEQLKTNLGSEQTWNALLEISTGFICGQDDKIIGMAFIIPSGNPSDIFKAGWSYIRMVGVDPAYRGYGIAKALTKSCIDHAKATGEKIIALHTSEKMPAARHIYENFGFKILQEIEPRLGMKYWIYTLELNQPG